MSRASLPEPRGRGIPYINPITGLSTDYLNHFSEAVMVLEMAATMPDCLQDLRAWRPKTYCEHFASSRFSDRDVVIAAYDAADPAVRDALDAAAETLNAVLAETRNVVLGHIGTPAQDALTKRALTWLKPLLDAMDSQGCIGQLSEIYEALPPHRPVGCFAQAWSVAEVLRLADELHL